MALEFIMEEQGCGPLCHVLDDFLIVSEPNFDIPSTKLKVFRATCEELGVPLSEKKTEMGTRLVLLGIEQDTVAMQEQKTHC